MEKEKNRQIVILSSISAFMLPSLISRICEIESLGVAVVLDSKDVSEKDKHIWEFRTGGLVEYEKEGLYGFAARGVCFYFVENHNSMECARLLNNINPALIVNGGTPRKLKSEILRILFFEEIWEIENTLKY